MKLAKEEVERIKQFSISMQTADLASDNLAMRAMLEELMRGNECPSCRNIGCHRTDCKLKELIG